MSGLSSPQRLPAQVVDEVVRTLASEVGAQPHHHRFRHDEAVGDVEIGAHALLVDLEPFQDHPRLPECPRGEAERLRQRDPFDLPRPRRARVVGDAAIEQRRRVLALRPMIAAWMYSDEIGLRFWGMVLLEPRPCANGS